MGKKALSITKKNIKEKIKINKNNCWIWQGWFTNNGYGQLSIKKKRYRPHRIAAYLWLNFDINSNLLICHKCDVPSCVNPKHLFIGNGSDNALDSVRKGRWVNNKGSRHGNSLLNENDILFIDTLLQAKWTHPTIAYVMGVKYGTIRSIAERRTWKHVKGE